MIGILQLNVMRKDTKIVTLNMKSKDKEQLLKNFGGNS